MPVYPKTIVLKSHGATRYDEARAHAAIKPGHLMATHTNGKLKVHASAGSFAEIMVAIEDALQGKTIDDAYAEDDLVRLVRAVAGDCLYMWIAAGVDADIEDFLTSNGDGTLKVATSTDERLFAVEETVDNSAGGAAVRCKVRVM